MDLLISWSKAQSHVVGMALHKWLPTVIPSIRPWISSKDIAKGREWFRELQNALAQARACIICITPENVRSPWIYYETGAIAAKEPEVFIYPYLVGVSPNMLSDGPLEKWQCTTADREDTWALIKSLNSDVLTSRHNLSLLETNFGVRWPAFAAQIQPVIDTEVEDEAGFVATDADLLAGVNLSAEARTIILAVSQDSNGMLLYTKSTDSGPSFQVNGVNLCPDQLPRTVARWKAAMDHLIAHKILEAHGDQGMVFLLTAKGYEIADVLRSESPPKLRTLT